MHDPLHGVPPWHVEEKPASLYLISVPLSLGFATEAEIRHKTSEWGYQSRGRGAKGMEERKII